jgi:hypothetical protein
MGEYGVKGVYLYGRQEVEDFITEHGGKWPVRGYAYTRKVTYYRKRDGGVTVRHLPTLFISWNTSISERIESVGETVDLSQCSNEGLGYF